MARPLRGSWAFALAVLLPTSAQAYFDPSTCDTTTFPGPLEVTPASGAGNVSTDAPVKVLYTAGYFADPLTPYDLVLQDDAGNDVPGQLQVQGDYLFFVPDSELAPSSGYSGTAYGTDPQFDRLDFTFHTGLGPDTGPPLLGPIQHLQSSRVPPSCDAPSGGYRIDVQFVPAQDDSSLGSVEYLLYLARGPTVDVPELVARARHNTTNLFTMAFVLTEEEAASPVCLAVHAVDGVGNVGEGAGIKCIDPIQGNYFAPLCSAAPGGATSPALALAVLAALAVAVVRRRRVC